MLKGSMPTEGETQKKTWRDSVPIDMLLSAVSVLVVAQPSSEVPEGLMNYHVYYNARPCERQIQISHSLFLVILLISFVEYRWSGSCPSDTYRNNGCK